MKKLMSLAMIIILTVSFTGCFKSDELEENKIKAPAPTSMPVEGVWEILEQYKVKDNYELEKISKIDESLISISREEISIQNIEINNPKFKFKRVSNEYFPKEFNSVIKVTTGEDNLIDVISISDSTNLNIEFIKASEDKGYIYTVGELMVVQKVYEGSEKPEEKIKNTEIANYQKKKGQDSGVLIGIKEPSVLGENKVITPAVYKTLWVYSKDGKIQKPKVVDGLLLPRMNGGFSDINLKTSIVNDEKLESLNVVNQNKAGKITENKKSDNKIYREITFVGKDYLGLQYYDEGNKNNDFNKYKIIPLDSIENNKELTIEDLYGAKGLEAYESSREKFISNKDKEFLKDYDVENADMGNVTVTRKNGKWIIKGKINSKKDGLEDLEFDIDLPVAGTLSNWDNLPLTWNKIKEIIPSAKDSLGSPIGDFTVVLNNSDIEVYNIDELEENKESVLTFPIKAGSKIVMGEWATGNDFVTTWDKVVDSKIK